MLVVALLAGLAAAALAGRWLSRQASVASGQVVVASRDIALGQPLSAALLDTIAWPASTVPKGSFAATAELEGRVAMVALQRGEPVLESRLAATGTRGGLSALIPAGSRAMTVKVNEIVGVAGFALPGNYVDVMVSTDDANQRPVSKIVLERILVLAIAQEAARDETRPKVVNAVTLEVTPAQAEMLDLARSTGNLSLVLRNPIDREALNTGGARKEDLMGAMTAPAAIAQVAMVSSAQPKAVPSAKPRPLAREAGAKKPMGSPVLPAPTPAPKPEPDDGTRIEVIRGIQRAGVQP